jgi:hypothetical protein
MPMLIFAWLCDSGSFINPLLICQSHCISYSCPQTNVSFIIKILFCFFCKLYSFWCSLPFKCPHVYIEVSRIYKMNRCRIDLALWKTSDSVDVQYIKITSLNLRGLLLCHIYNLKSTEKVLCKCCRCAYLYGVHMHQVS